MFLYLSRNGSRVYLPKAVAVHSDGHDSDEIGFYGDDGKLVASFRREDVFLYSRNDLGLFTEPGQRSQLQ